MAGSLHAIDMGKKKDSKAFKKTKSNKITKKERARRVSKEKISKLCPVNHIYVNEKSLHIC